MAESGNMTLSCPACGKQYAWQAHLAGRRVACKCGTVFQAPAAPPQVEDAYDLTEDPAAAAPAPVPTTVLTYESKEVVKEERRRIRNRILEEWRVRDLWLPITLITLGAACKLLFPLSQSTNGAARGVVVMGLVALATAFNVLLMLGAVMIASRLVELEPGPPIQAVVKLGLMFVVAASAGGFAASISRFDSLGVGVGVNIVILLYWILFALLFKAGVVETMMSIAIICILQAIFNLGIWRM